MHMSIYVQMCLMFHCLYTHVHVLYFIILVYHHLKPDNARWWMKTSPSNLCLSLLCGHQASLGLHFSNLCPSLTPSSDQVAYSSLLLQHYALYYIFSFIWSFLIQFILILAMLVMLNSILSIILFSFWFMFVIIHVSNAYTIASITQLLNVFFSDKCNLFNIIFCMNLLNKGLCSKRGTTRAVSLRANKYEPPSMGWWEIAKLYHSFVHN